MLNAFKQESNFEYIVHEMNVNMSYVHVICPHGLLHLPNSNCSMEFLVVYNFHYNFTLNVMGMYNPCDSSTNKK